MRVGVVFPQNEIGRDPGGVREYAQAAQDAGYVHLIAYDHVLGADPAGHPGWDGPYDVDSMFHEPFVLFGYLSAVAPELELLPSVIILPQRQTALVAKQAAEVDVLTGGKTRLGVGLGWNRVEYEALGATWEDRGSRFEEQIGLLRRFWTERSFSFDGEHHTVTAAGINPLPVQQPIPIWIGAGSRKALRRAARVADGFLAGLAIGGGGAAWTETMEQLRSWLEEEGRDPATFGIDAQMSVGTGGPDDWNRRAERWRELGATHLSLMTAGASLGGPAAHIARLQEAREALGDYMVSG